MKRLLIFLAFLAITVQFNCTMETKEIYYNEVAEPESEDTEPEPEPDTEPDPDPDPDPEPDPNTIPEPQPPNAPSNITAINGDSEITIEWDPVTNADSYNIYYSITQGIHDAIVYNAVSPYIHTGLVNGNVYYYVITAINSVGESVESLEVYATPGIFDNMDGSISILSTGLTWAKCSQTNSYGGNMYNSIDNDCSSGSAARLVYCDINYTCDDSIKLVGGNSEVFNSCNALSISGGGWRVPSGAELMDLHPIYASNSNLWPDLVQDMYWSGNGYSIAPWYGYVLINISTGNYTTPPIDIPSFPQYVICVK